jgi:hypothetical protein
MQYDSNVPLAANSTQLTSLNIERKSDMRGILNLGLSGIAIRDDKQELTGSYSLYQTLHLKLTEYNLTQNLLDVSYKRKISPLLTAKASAGFESIQLGGDQFVNDFSLSPGLFASYHAGMITGLEYRIRDSFFKNTDTFTTNTDRDGITHSIILSHRQPITETINLRLSYTFERELTDVKAWSSTAHLGSLGLAVSLPHSLLFDIGIDGAARKYDEILDLATKIRSDTTLTGVASLTWQASEHLGASVGYHYTDNSSNITDYEYKRGITSIMIQGRY